MHVYKCRDIQSPVGVTAMRKSDRRSGAAGERHHHPVTVCLEHGAKLRAPDIPQLHCFTKSPHASTKKDCMTAEGATPNGNGLAAPKRPCPDNLHAHAANTEEQYSDAHRSRSSPPSTPEKALDQEPLTLSQRAAPRSQSARPSSRETQAGPVQEAFPAGQQLTSIFSSFFTAPFSQVPSVLSFFRTAPKSPDDNSSGKANGQGGAQPAPQNAMERTGSSSSVGSTDQYATKSTTGDIPAGRSPKTSRAPTPSSTDGIMTHGSTTAPTVPTAPSSLHNRRPPTGTQPSNLAFSVLRSQQRHPPLFATHAAHHRLQSSGPAVGTMARTPSAGHLAAAQGQGQGPLRLGPAAGGTTAAAAASRAQRRTASEPPARPRGPGGPFVRYILAPMVLLPVAWPWLLLRAAHTCLAVAGGCAAMGLEVLLVVAEVVRRNRLGVEAVAGWGMGWLGWVVGSYWAALVQLHQACEEALVQLLALATPLAATALQRSPLLATAARPLLSTLYWGQEALHGAYVLVERCYCWLHDEIVPVALDLAERLPLVPHGLLHAAMAGGRS